MIVFFNLQKKKKFTETTDLANTCADLSMQSLPTGAFSSLAPIQTETELTKKMAHSLPSYLTIHRTEPLFLIKASPKQLESRSNPA